MVTVACSRSGVVYVMVRYGSRRFADVFGRAGDQAEVHGAGHDQVDQGGVRRLLYDCLLG